MRLIACAGNAQSGKDTFYKLVSTIDPRFQRYAFADTLKQDLELVIKKLGLDIWNLKGDQKTLCRELLVSYGSLCRTLTKGRHFINSLDKKLKEESPDSVVITDLRYVQEANDELDWVRSLHGKVVYIERITSSGLVQPANLHEEKNNEVLREEADFIITWPTLPNPQDINSLLPYVENAMKSLDI